MAPYRELVQDNVCIDWANTLHACIHLDFVVDLGGKLPFENESFDTILLTDVLEHLAEPVEAVGEIARTLRLDGKLIIGVPFFYWIHEGPHDYDRYTEFALRRICRLAAWMLLISKPTGVLQKFYVTSQLSLSRAFLSPWLNLLGAL